jgi:predicted DCC family thiol-disulfide oxidoreductase YuxK
MQVLLYDGLCGFCDSTVQFVLARDHGGSMKFATLQGQFAAQIIQQQPELQAIDSLILVDTSENGAHPQVKVRSAAALGVAEYLGGPWKGALLLKLVPRPLRDWAYDLFARNRHRWFGRYDACPLPTPEQRQRFLP